MNGPPEIPAEGAEPSWCARSGLALRLSNRGQRDLLLAIVKRGALCRTRVRGFSMTPFIRDGDVVTIAPLGGRAPRLGDVVAFVRAATGQLAIHRVIGHATDGWRIGGDRSDEPDGIVEPRSIVGRVVRVERGGRRVRLGLGGERAFVALLSRGGHLARLARLWHLLRRVTGFHARAARGRTPVGASAERRLPS